jgi:predicted transcriptional regulator
VNLNQKKDEPKIWFNSIKSLAHVLSEENQELLGLIVEIHPKSIKELEDVTGRKANNLLRTLRTMESYGFVKLKEGESGKGRTPLVPEVIYNSAKIAVNLS